MLQLHCLVYAATSGCLTLVSGGGGRGRAGGGAGLGGLSALAPPGRGGQRPPGGLGGRGQDETGVTSSCAV